MSKPVRLCKDCKHIVWDGKSAKCDRSKTRNYVTGEMRRVYCSVERGGIDLNSCGKKGKCWEPNGGES